MPILVIVPCARTGDICQSPSPFSPVEVTSDSARVWLLGDTLHCLMRSCDHSDILFRETPGTKSDSMSLLKLVL